MAVYVHFLVAPLSNLIKLLIPCRNREFLFPRKVKVSHFGLSDGNRKRDFLCIQNKVSNFAELF